MTNHPAGWRFPTMKQLEKLPSPTVVGRNEAPGPAVGPADDLPSEYWASLLRDARADAAYAGKPIQALTLSEIAQHVLRVGCRRCARTVEIQKVDAVRLAGPEAVWKDFGQRLLDDTCRQRTGRHEEDGCWPVFE